ncbi:hypothetical protein PNOK_0057500 [Pyrrhoderma noxium]|uniref:Metaxin glutathione S-transferase domain-containing protein n=1 Tax=Pyrrhoderma noxium TaxID=2282107 RepID=A0A286UV99_9AGAM|nr:hypothetical protein PNOK_0057500 [Pyrrhoderma noxium]
MTETSYITVPDVVRNFFSKFPLHTYPAEDVTLYSGGDIQKPTLWILPPKFDNTLLSSDVECLKWQAYIALRGLKDVKVRWDISPEGGVDGHLPTLVTKMNGKAEVVGSSAIPGWVDGVLSQKEEEGLEGYKDSAAKDESRAWVSLLEGTVHSAFLLANPTPLSLLSLLLYTPHPHLGKSSPQAPQSISTHISPPPAPLSGFTSVFPLYGERVSFASVQAQYHDAITALSDRLGNDVWFLGSSQPTALDALLFAYLHCLLNSPDIVRLDVARRTNLVEWERRVQARVKEAFVKE